MPYAVNLIEIKFYKLETIIEFIENTLTGIDIQKYSLHENPNILLKRYYANIYFLLVIETTRMMKFAAKV